MKIRRNGQEFELTFLELMDAYNEYKLNSIIEDIESICQQEDRAIDLSENDIKKIAIQAKYNLTKNDSYYDAYWSSIKYTMKEYVQEHGRKED